jgi:hypothetical protein
MMAQLQTRRALFFRPTPCNNITPTQTSSLDPIPTCTRLTVPSASKQLGTFLPLLELCLLPGFTVFLDLPAYDICELNLLWKLRGVPYVSQ